MSYASSIQTNQYAPRFLGIFLLKIKANRPRKIGFIVQLALLLFLVMGQAMAAYIPPIGIPAPGFGIDEVRPDRPASWLQEVPGYYYIDQVNGSTTQAYGTPSAPRQLLPRPIPAGSYIEVHGRYTHAAAGATWIEGQGTDESWVAGVSGPVWIVGENMVNAPTFTRKIIVLGTYVYIDTIKMADGGRMQVGSSAVGRFANHVMLRNSEITGVSDIAQAATLLSASGSDLGEARVHHIIFYNNKVQGGVVLTIPQDRDISGIAMSGAHHVWVLNNEVHNTLGSGVYVAGRARSGGGPLNTHHL